MAGIDGIGGNAWDSTIDGASQVQDAPAAASDAVETTTEQTQAEPVPVEGALASRTFSASMLQGLVSQKLDDTESLDAAQLGAVQRTGDEEPLDLSDPAKRAQLLATWGQVDDLEDTDTDQIRCQSNVAIAALLLKGGPEELKRGLESARIEARQALQAEQDKPEPNKEQIKRLEKAIATFDRTIEKLPDKVTRSDLDRASNALYDTFESWPDAPTSSGGGMKGSNITYMEQKLGLTVYSGAHEVGEDSGLNLKDDNQEVVDNLFAKLEPGESGHVGVNLNEKYFERGEGPNGEKIHRSKRGVEYYRDRKTGKPVFRKPNHAILFGRDKDGKRYLYDPLGKPSYVSEDSPDFEKRAKQYITKNKDGDYYAPVTRFGRA